MTMGIEEEEEISCEFSAPMPLLALNHVSFVCRSVANSVKFYQQLLGFVLIKRPSSFNFSGAWLYNYGVGIHLLESEKAKGVRRKPRVINPKDNHISFHCSEMGTMKRKLEEMGMKYVTAVVEERGIKVDQIFFHDPDGHMIEICNCENLPILPLSTCPFSKDISTNSKPIFSDSSFMLPPDLERNDSIMHDLKAAERGLLESLMMESLSMDMLNMSF